MADSPLFSLPPVGATLALPRQSTFNAGSTAGTPQADNGPAGASPVTDEPMGASLVTGPQGASPADPDEIDAWAKASPDNNPNEAQLRTMWDAKQARTIPQSIGRGAKGAVTGLWQTAKNLVTSPFRAAAELGPVGLALVAGVPLPASPEVAQKQAQIGSSLVEGASGAASGAVDLVRKPVNYLTSTLPQDLGDPATAYDRWKQQYLEDLALSRQTISGSAQEFLGVKPADVVQPLPGVSDLVNNAASLAMLEGAGKALGSARRALPGAAAEVVPKTAVAEAIDSAGAPKGATLAETVADKTGAAVENVGNAVATVASLPRKVVSGTIEKLVGKFLPEEVQGQAEGYLAHDVLSHVPGAKAVLGGLGAVEGASTIGAKAGQAIQKIAQADPTHPYGRLAAVAADPESPGWLRSIANSGLVKTGAAALDTAAGTLPSVAKNAAIGAGFNAGASVLSGDDAEQVGEAAGSGAAFGGALGSLSATSARRAQIFKRQQGAMTDWVHSHIAEGIAPETLAKVPDSVATEAATMEKLGLKDGQGNSLKIRALDTPAFDAAGGSQYTGSDAFHNGANNTIYLNADQLAKNGTWSTLFHEAMHPLFDSVVASQPELRATMDKAIADSGKTLDQAKSAYAFSLIRPQLESLGLVKGGAGKIRITDPVKVKAAVDNAVAERTAASVQGYGNPDHWIYSEIMAEAAKHAMTGKDTIGVINDGAVKGIASRMATKLFEALGGTTRSNPSFKSVIPGFENVIADPSMRQSVYRLLNAQKEYIPGVTKIPERGVHITKEMWGKSPLAPLRDLGKGTKGNDFVLQSANGTVLPRSPKAVKKIVGARRDEMNKAYPTTDRPVPTSDKSPEVKNRRTPSGKVERTGTVLGDKYQNAKTVGDHTKAFAKDIETAIANGEARSGIYHQIASGDGKARAKSLERDSGNLEAQAKDFIPYNFTISKAGNVLVNNYDLTALTKKAQEWAARHGSLSLDEWHGNIPAFKDDVRQYLKNHAANLPGDANNLGQRKRDVLNAFLLGGNKAFEASNPLRPLLKGDNRRGIIRSYRLDRLETLEPHDSNFTKPSYDLQLKNYSPKQDEYKLPIQKDGTSKAWITPDGKTVTLTGWHAQWLNDNAREMLKYGLRGAKTMTDAPESKGKALAAGLGRVNLANGKLGAEFAENKFTPKAKDALLKTIEHNIGNIITVDISLLNKKGEIVGGEEEHVRRDMDKVRAMDTFSGEKPGTHAVASDNLFTKAVQENVRKNFSPQAPLNEDLGKRVADFYDEAKHEPESPAVVKSYKALSTEAVQQWKDAQAEGMKFEPWTKPGQPYKTSDEMRADVTENKHLYYFPTEKGFGTGDEASKHPMLSDSGVKDSEGNAVPVNDVFRAIHDYYGHAKTGAGFGPRGEYNAFLAHSKMFSEDAKPAMAMETMGQNSWVNFGKHLRNAEGVVPAKGEPGHIAAPDRPYADQKANVLPEDLLKESTTPKNFSPTAREDEKAPVYYSQLAKTIESKFSGKEMPAAQLAAIVRNPNSGVKADELKWSGLDDFLRGKGRVSKQEVRQFLTDNQLQIKEVTKGTRKGFSQDREDELLEEHARTEFDMPYDELDEDQKEEIRNLVDEKGNPDTKFENYQLPGGSNYREVLFQLPPKTDLLASDTVVRRILGEDGQPIDKIGVYKGDTLIYYGERVSEHGGDEQKAINSTREKFLSAPDTSLIPGKKKASLGNFTSQHWDEPNVLAHTRLNDREDSEGKPGLFAEELQSDWHQKGRKDGYDVPKNSILEGAAQAKYGKSFDQLNEAQQLSIEDEEHVTSKGGVPDAPYKTTWHELVLRRLIRMAAEEGKDWVGWTTGEQQAARYDLSKSIDELMVSMSPDGTYSLKATLPGGGDHNIGSAISKDKLSDYVGKDLATKITIDSKNTRRDGSWGDVYDAEDLKVGGEGMKGFYDKILVDYANKFGKKFGSKVEDREVPSSDSNTMVERVDTGVGTRYRVRRAGVLLRSFSDLDMANKFARAQGEEEATVHSLPITPEMKKSVLGEGVAQFSPKSEPKEKEQNVLTGSPRSARLLAVNAQTATREGLKRYKLLRDEPDLAPEEKEELAKLRPVYEPLTKYPTQPDTSLNSSKGWIAPNGTFYPLEGITHEHWAREAAGDLDKDNASSDLYKKGWLRTTLSGAKSIASNGDSAPTPKQERTLKDIAIHNELNSWHHDNGKRTTVLWSKDNNFSPAAARLARKRELQSGGDSTSKLVTLAASTQQKEDDKAAKPQ